MKTIKLIVFLSLFLVSHSTFAQMSPKLQTFLNLMNEVNTEIGLIKDKKEEERTAEENNDLVVLEMYKKQLEDSISQYIQKEEARRKINAALKNIPNENEKQKIQEYTEDLYARKISPAEYQRRIEEILFKRIEIFNNIQRYDSQMNNIKKDLFSKIYEKTNLKIEINNMQKDPNFSNEVDKIYYEEKRRYLPKSTKEEIQQTYNVAVNIYANLASKKENAKKEYDELQKALDSLNVLCPDCKQE